MKGKNFYMKEKNPFELAFTNVYTKKVEKTSDYKFEWSLKDALKMDPLP